MMSPAGMTSGTMMSGDKGGVDGMQLGAVQPDKSSNDSSGAGKSPARLKS